MMTSAFNSSSKDKRGRVIKTEEDFLTAEVTLSDGSTARFRAGKILSVHPASHFLARTQELRQAAIEASVVRETESVQPDVKRKPPPFQR